MPWASLTARMVLVGTGTMMAVACAQILGVDDWEPPATDGSGGATTGGNGGTPSTGGEGGIGEGGTGEGGARPEVEKCQTPEDDDNSGTANDLPECVCPQGLDGRTDCLELIRATVISGVGRQVVTGLATNSADGRIAVVGTFGEELAVGGTVVETNAGDATGPLFVLVLDANHSYQWHATFGASPGDLGSGVEDIGFEAYATNPQVAFDSAGNVVVGASMRGTVSVDNCAAQTITGTAGLIVKLNSSGDRQWHRWLRAEPVGGERFFRVRDIATTASDHIVVTGDYRNTPSAALVLDASCNDVTPLDCLDSVPPEPTIEVWNARLSPASGEATACSIFASTEDARGLGVSTRGETVFLTGFFNGTTTFGSYTLPVSPSPEVYHIDFYVVTADESLQPTKAPYTVAGEKNEGGRRVIPMNDDNDLVVVGYTRSDTLGGATKPEMNYNMGPFVARAGGLQAWLSIAVGSKTPNAPGVVPRDAVVLGDSVYVAGVAHSSAVNFYNNARMTSELVDDESETAFLFRWSTSGVPEWAVLMGQNGMSERIDALGVTMTGHLLAGGSSDGGFSFGNYPIVDSDTDGDAFVVELAP
jgi:hypothetical protein